MKIRNVAPYAVPLLFALGLSIISGALSTAFGGEATDAFAPIKASTEEDPAGMRLMFISIGILVTMVLAIFGTTMWYMLNTGKKKARPASAHNATTDETPAEAASTESESSEATE